MWRVAIFLYYMVIDGVLLKTPHYRGWVRNRKACESFCNKMNVHPYPHVKQLFLLTSPAKLSKTESVKTASLSKHSKKNKTFNRLLELYQPMTFTEIKENIRPILGK